MARPRLHDPTSAYHEAGHAVAFWHHGIRFRYVTLSPRNAAHGGHVYVGRRAEISDPAKMRIEMQLAAAGEIAYGRMFRLRSVSDDDTLLRRFARMAADPASPWLDEDMRNFARMGGDMDAALRAAVPDTVTGPLAWLAIWRDTEHLIRNQLWPAVYAVAWELVFSRHGFTYAEVSAMAVAALEAHAA
jgi:hypothetical protein